MTKSIPQNILLKRRKALPNKWKSCNYAKVKVESIEGVCTSGFQVGDEWVLQKFTPQSEFCGIAYGLLYPTIRTVVFGGVIPFAEGKPMRVACPDAKNRCVFTVEPLDSKLNSD